MFNPKQYRDKATEYDELAKTADGLDDTQKFRQLERNFTTLADNEQWLSDNHRKIVRRAGADSSGGNELVAQEEHLLRCLGAALIMEWNSIPGPLQRALFDSAGSVGDLTKTEELRGRIARFLHRNKDV